MRISFSRRLPHLFCAVCLLFSSRIFAQLSPGDLHSTHALLEGVANCSKCHGTNQKILADNCLTCHTSIKKSLEQKSGLHGRNEFLECVLCHVEHQGRDYDLVYWEKGRDHFDHIKTGYELKGKHSEVQCQNCHQPKNIRSNADLVEEKRSLDRTFFGLSQDCASCHFDEHRGQLSNDCAKCHNVDGWKPAPGFNHSQAKFVLTGKHIIVQCEKCHKPQSDLTNSADPSFSQFTGLAFQACTDCHQDAHNGKLGQNCTGCHNTDSWRSKDRVNFDHSKTKFPLLGQHSGLVCEKCHKPGQPFAGLKFDKCRHCHEDFHRGEFAKRPSQGACEECHTVYGYRPAKFTVDQHQQSDYPLKGAHLAVPCDGCHQLKSQNRQGAEYRFEFKSQSCESCHGDPHKGSQLKIAEVKTCEGCHNVDSFQLVQFDHAKTKFPLVGKHATTACKNCHSEDPKAFDPAAMKFVLTNYSCADCHQDIHLSQFATGIHDPVTDCARCHFSTTWNELKFNHNRDSAYKLEGAHAKIPCSSCHKKESLESASVVRYKPLGTECKDCHESELLKDRTRP